MKPKYIIGIVAALALIATAVMSVENTKIEYMGVAQAKQASRTGNVIGAWVKEKGQAYDADANEFRFTLADSTGEQLPVVLHGAKPNNFEMSVSVVATGRVEDGVFHATNVLTKCPSKYESGGESLKEY
jgi:cytochrome c-type biogenesis protein CcmE